MSENKCPDCDGRGWHCDCTEDWSGGYCGESGAVSCFTCAGTGVLERELRT